MNETFASFGNKLSTITDCDLCQVLNVNCDITLSLFWPFFLLNILLVCLESQSKYLEFRIIEYVDCILFTCIRLKLKEFLNFYVFIYNSIKLAEKEDSERSLQSTGGYKEGSQSHYYVDPPCLISYS